MTRSTRIAVLSAVALMAYQVGGKAVRDAIYLSQFEVTTLPRMLVLAAVLSIVGAIGAARLFSRYGPGRLIPAFFILSALFSVAEWMAFRSAPRLVAVALFVHVAVLGSVLISGFWAAFGEAFDPRTVKRTVGNVAAAATLGGVIGGVVAERVGATFGVAAVLPALAGMHLVCAWLTRGLSVLSVGGEADSGKVPSATSGQTPSAATSTTPATSGSRLGLRSLRSVPYLRDLSLLVVLTATAGTVVDYVFKARATAAFDDAQQLVRFFALFYTAVSILTFIVQSSVGRRVLERIGLTWTMTFLPAFVGLGSVGAMAVPALLSATLLRGSEQVLRSSFFRSAYELLFTPLAPDEKRATKSVIDVACDRLGDAVGAGLVALALLLAPGGALPLLLGLSAVAAVVGIWLVRRLGRGYVAELERSLLRNRVVLDMKDVLDLTTRMTLQTIHGMRIASGVPAGGVASKDRPGSRGVPDGEPEGARIESGRLRDLQSEDAARVIRALRDESPLSAAMVDQAITLLAWDAVAVDAIAALRRTGERAASRLVAALVDPDQYFAIRRRVPRALVGQSGPEVIEALIQGLSDRRFEVRYHCGLALARIQKTDSPHTIPAPPIFAAVEREARAGAAVWAGQRLLDTETDDGEWSSFGSDAVDRVVRERSTRSLEHVFTLLSVVLPRDPLRVAYCALHGSDPLLRGTALEYLESVLPDEIREALWPHLEQDPEEWRSSEATPDRAAVLERLLQSHRSVMAKLEVEGIEPTGKPRIGPDERRATE